jgi:hypothetical protein
MKIPDDAYIASGNTQFYIEGLYLSGESEKDIAEEIGIPYDFVCWILEKNRVRSKRRYGMLTDEYPLRRRLK